MDHFIFVLQQNLFQPLFQAVFICRILYAEVLRHFRSSLIWLIGIMQQR